MPQLDVTQIKKSEPGENPDPPHDMAEKVPNIVLQLKMQSQKK